MVQKISTLGRHALGAGIATLALAPAMASAAPASTSFTCSASAASVSLGGQTLDPLHANTSPDASCSDQGATVPSLVLNDALGAKTVSANSGTAAAFTALLGAGGPLAGQTAAGQAQIENLDLNLGGGALHVQAQTIYGAATAKCVNGAYTPASFSRAVGLKINGQDVVGDQTASIPLSAGLASLTDQLAATPLSGLVRVALEKSRDEGSGDDATRVTEAARIELLSAAGSPAVTIVLGRATAGRHGDVCKVVPTTPPTDGNPGGGGGTNTNTNTNGNTNTSGNGSGNNGASTTGSTTKSSTSTKAVPNGTNASSCARLKVFYSRGKGIPKSGPTRLVSRFGVRQVVRGRIVNCNGKAITNAKLDVVHYKRGNVKAIKTGLRSRPGGKLTMILPLDLTSRRIVVSYRPFTNRSKVASRKTLTLTVMRHGKVLR